MKKFLLSVLAALMTFSVYAADDFQVANADFEDWSGAAFDGVAQPKGWNASNVTQFGFKFNFAHKETGRSGSAMMVQDQSVGAAGITETSPGYFSLGQPWVYIASLTAVSQASAGTYGGISFTHRPDTMSVWIKRTGSNVDKEDFYLLVYSWTGTAYSKKYKGKNGSCTSTEGYTDEESDIRQALDGNECGTTTMAKQIAEGMWRERKTYGNWTNIRVPIYYMNNDVPQKMNIIFSASNYPNFRANSGLYTGNSLYVDDVEFIYSSKIQKLYVDGAEWKGFDPNSSEIQYFSLGESATEIPSIEALRGVGTLTNARGNSASFAGRTLSGSEISITKGDLSSTPTVITVKSEDGKSTTTYKIQFQKAASSNAKLAGITINGAALNGFTPTKYSYDVDLPYGTKEAPVVAAEGQEDKQNIEITQPASVNGTATIKVTAANGKNTQTYTLTFKVGLLADNELQDILVNGKSIPGFTPSQTVYKVSLPVTTTEMPVVTTVSKPEYGNDQKVVHTKPSVIDGGLYQLSVTTPGNQIAKVYKLNFKLEKSSYTYLKDLKVGGKTVADFAPDNFTYYINLPMGTTAIPAVTYTVGDEFQTVAVTPLADGVLDGTVRVTVTAGNGDQSVYKLIFSTDKSDRSTLAGIKIGGVDLPGFDPDKLSYEYNLPVGTTELPEIEPIPGDEYQKITVTTAGLNGKTRIAVTAGDGSTTIYLIAFSVATFTDNTLAAIYLDGKLIDGFDPEKLEYSVNLPQGTTALPEVTYDLKDPNFQTASVRTVSGLNGDYKITVRPQTGASRTYVIHFSVATSNNTALKSLSVAGYELTPAFDPEVLDYDVKLAEGVTKIPAVSFEKAESSQRVLSVLDGKVQKITVTAQSGDTRTYTITFELTISENSKLKMIYLDSVPLADFNKDETSYKVALKTPTCPVITVDKEPGQQVTITAPYAEGTAQIKVQPLQGEYTIYEITFTMAPAASTLLAGIRINGDDYATFEPETFAYTRSYTGSLPKVEGVPSDPSQTIQVLWKGEVASIHVTDAEGNKAVYTITFTRQLQSNNTLKAILVNGTPLDKFKPEILAYDSVLAPGTAFPEVTYVAADNAQVVFFGQLAEGKWGITVEAEDGTSAMYTVTFTIAPYTDATLENLVVEGYALSYAPETYEYGPFSIDQGVTLPVITPTTKPGQTVIIYNLNDHEQKVIVRAQNGAEKTYTIKYTRVLSNNALLKAIYIDGEELLSFRPEIKDYTITLPRGTKAVPNVFPVGQLNNQTITTTFSRPDGVTTIHVESQDGTETTDYSIAFPVEKSETTLLKSLTINSEAKDVNETEFTFSVPFNQTEPYVISYEKNEGQLIRLVEAPLTGTTKIFVTNEKGDNTRTYTINYIVAAPQGENKLKNVKYSYVTVGGETVNGNIVPNPGENIIDLPYGAKEFTVTEIEKNYDEQSIQFYNGGIRRGATIIAVANRTGEDDVTFTLTPKMPEFDTTGKLQDLQFNGTTVPNFRPDVYNYIVNVSSEPVAENFVCTAYDSKTVTPSAIDKKKKQITFTVEGGETYSVCWFYDGDEWPFNHNWIKTNRAHWYKVNTLGGIFSAKADDQGETEPTGYKPSGWAVPADYLAYIDYDATLSHFTYYTGKEVTRLSDNEFILSTIRGGALNSSMPGVMTLGSIYFPDGIRLNGGTKVSYDRRIAGGVEYHNTPEQFAFDYQPIMSYGINKWKAWVSLGGEGIDSVAYELEGTYDNKEKWTTAYQSLTYNFKVQKINIALCASDFGETVTENHGTWYKPNYVDVYYGERLNIYDGDEAKSADLQIRNMRMVYNSELTGVTVNGNATVKSGNTFTYTLGTDEVIVGIPSLKFTGKVQDQTQTIEWLNNGEWINGDLTARVINYGENALVEGRDSTIYTVVLHRDPVTSVEHTADFGTLATETKDDTVFVNLPFGAKTLPDLKITPASVHQLISMTKKGNAVTVKVTAEDGSEKTTVYAFREIKSNSVDFESALSAEDQYGNDVPVEVVDVTTFTYSVTAEQMPKFVYTKLQGQLVDINYTANQVVLKVTAADGKTTRTYTINRLDPEITTKGQIEQFNGEIKKAGGQTVTTADFGGDNYEVTAKRPTGIISFALSDSTDAVVFIQSPLKMEWQVTGTAFHTYILTYPTEASNTDTLSMIRINGEDYELFDALTEDYPIYSDTSVYVSAVEGEETQTISTTATSDENGVEYDITVTAEDGTTTRSYKVRVQHPRSSDATLDGIMLDSVMIAGFDPDILTYEVILPTPAVKTAQPQMPSVTYIAEKGQTVTVEPGALNGEATTFEVTSEDGSNTKIYELAVKAEPSHCVDLTGITVNGEAIQGDKDETFEPGRHFYSLSLKTSTINVDYTSDDRFQTVTIDATELETDSKYRYILHVVAEDGVTTADYQVNIYVQNKSNDANLANILLDGKNLSDFERALNEKLTFDPGQNFYEVYLPSGTTILPEVSAQLRMEGQTVAIDQKGDSVLLNVTAVDGSTNQYVLSFIVPLSKNADLDMIFLNGDSLKGFDPAYYFYQIDLPVGTHSLPEVAAQKSEEAQTILPIEIDNDKLQATIKVQAEDPATRVNTYVIVFHFTQSDADTLAMIYQDGKPLAGYQPKNTYYALPLPVGTTAFPDLAWEEADDWQTVKMDTVEVTEDKLIRQILVTSESGKKNTYTVSYTILKSDVDTLQNLYVDKKALEEFEPRKEEYYYTLSASYAAELNGQVPSVEYTTGDEYQTVLVSQVRDSISGKSLGYKSIITVTAATGKTRTYTIHYPVQKSDEATLNMINLAGKPLENFDAERFNYKVEIDEQASVPVVTVIKKEEIQVVEISINEDVVTIDVTAEDGTKQTYTLVFERVRSALTMLRNIILTDAAGEKLPASLFPFVPETYSYTVDLPYSADKTIEEQLPTIEPVVFDAMQTTDSVHHLLPNGDVRVDITVTAPDGENQAVYSLIFHFLKPTDAMAVNILLADNELADFFPQKDEYNYAHPYGSSEADFFKVEDVKVVLSDPLATYTITQDENGTIKIRIVAQDGTTEMTYQISQSIAKDNDCLLSAIYLGEKGNETELLRDFDPEVTFYTYYLRQGAGTTPSVLGIAHSENASVEVREVSPNDTCTITCTADDGTKQRYYIHFAVSEVSEAAEPTGSDVIIKRLPGTNTLFIGTIRKDVHFALYDQNGHILVYKSLEPADPNDIVVTGDVETSERLNDVLDTRSGIEIEVNPEQIYFYTFFYGEKDFMQMLKGDKAKKLKSGKLILQR